jgi:3-oxoadipate enol-lactonase
MPFVAVHDITVHYDLAGPEDAPVILFANSLGTNFHVWGPQAAVLAATFRVLRYDMRGHGLTDCPAPAGNGGYTIDQLGRDALGLLDALGIAQAHFCGLSIGGMVGQRVAAAAPDRIRSLVLCDTANRIGPPAMWDDRIATIRSKGLASIVDGVMARWFTAGFAERHPAELAGMRNMLTRTPIDGYIGGALAVRDGDLRDDDGKIACPTLVIVGDQDLSTPPAAATELRQAIANARLAVIDGAAHIPTIEQPDAVTRLLREFLV